MTFPTDDIYLGPASFGIRKGTEGIIWHTTEASGTSRAHAVGTAEWQKRNPGSYNFIIYDGGILLTVPYLEASGGVNPGSASWAPGRFPWLKQSLSAAAYADPNAYLINVAFSGRTAVFRDQGLPANMLATAKQLVEWVEAQPWCTRMVQPGHLHWQTNRTDPSLQVLAAITGDDDMQFWKPVQEDWLTTVGAKFWDGAGNQKAFADSIRVQSIAESSDGVYRQLKYPPTAPNEILVAERAGLRPISGTRVPASPAYGFPPSTGVPLASWTALQKQSVAALRGIQSDADVAADAIEAKKP